MGERSTLGGKAGTIAIVRDGYGVPHVRAETAAGAWAGMGYACAQDRLFQLDYDRRRACGRWAEVAGFSALSGDVLARRLGLATAAKLDLAVMSPTVRSAFEAYATGVNQAISAGALPRPGTYQVEPWRAWHSVAAFLVRHVLMGQWQHKLVNAVLLARVGAAAFETTRDPAGTRVTGGGAPRRQAHPALAGLVEEALGEIERHLGFLAEIEPGSNAWAVSGRRTAHGAAVICNDSHRALDTPERVLAVPGDLPRLRRHRGHLPRAARIPALRPNGSVAWAITHADADTQDLYLERFDGTRYLTEDGWQQAEVRTERIEVRGGSPVTVTAWATRHGPVVHGHPGSGHALSPKWTARTGPTAALEVCPPCSRRAPSRNSPPPRTAGSTRSTTWSAPTPAGTSPTSAAASCRCGHRRRAAGCLYPAGTAECEWIGTVPFAELPRSVDPEAGFVMTANNVLTDASQPYVSHTFSQPWRAERLRIRLADSARIPPRTLPPCRRTRCPCRHRPGAACLAASASRIPPLRLRA